jgi:hypothetical protein
MVEPRQLNIFKGKRQKGEAPPTPKELELHIPLVKLIRLSLCEGWTFTHTAAGEHRDPRTAAKLKAMGVTPGFPDLIFFGPGGRVYFLELKRAGQGLSDVQKDLRFKLMSSGFDYHVTNSLKDAVDQLNALGIIRARVSA